MDVLWFPVLLGKTQELGLLDLITGLGNICVVRPMSVLFYFPVESSGVLHRSPWAPEISCLYQGSTIIDLLRFRNIVA